MRAHFRRQVNWLETVLLATLFGVSSGVQASRVVSNQAEPLNFLLITTDDLAFGIRGTEIVIGCMDRAARNYDPRANRHDRTLCTRG